MLFHNAPVHLSHMLALPLLGIAATVGALTWALLRSSSSLTEQIVGALEALSMAVRGGQGERLEQLEADVRELLDSVDRLPSKWEDVKREANSFYSRATHHVRRAREELSEHGVESAELEEIAQQLQLPDVGGGPAEAVPPVHPGLVGGGAWNHLEDPRDAEVEALIQSQWR